jgi:xylan 1,4-beta-xylosidase
MSMRSTIPALALDFQWLHSPWPEELFSLTGRLGDLRLHGRDTAGSTFRPAGRALAKGVLLYGLHPRGIRAGALPADSGLIYYYNSAGFHYLDISTDETLGKYLRVWSSNPAMFSRLRSLRKFRSLQVDRSTCGRISISSVCAFPWIGAGEGQPQPQQFDASILSDEAGPPGNPNFAEFFVGVCCQDLAGTRQPADFDGFEYESANSALNHIVGKAFIRRSFFG